ncbi:sensory histidine kinase in two-component regulatory system with PhoB [Georgfuchsia toluolica]|uniref:Phosphate regulon sensor protein PhoR n=1 Tax=Georgfuchsia toluolica TaxID=424218 RepID=A0A916J4X4_9PROT|nr:phosphate regulon sensor histidine kinase PhoR [Georgfuchsia toluolica]CAG4882527.1 sensory histidine kinase in two-component regulatory system with PhoB [Georgfuchsia toluolica]
MNFWNSLFLRLLLGALPCMVIGVFFGITAALIMACLLLLIAVILHWRLLNQLRKWLQSPATETVPDASGAWGQVFADLYRAQRDQERSRANLAASLERFREAAGALPDGVIMLDSENRIDWFNPAAQAQFGLDPGRDGGTLVTNLLRQPGFAEYIGGSNFSEPLLLRSVPSDARVFSVVVIPFAVSNRLLLSRDVSQIERVETMRRDFVANVSHELRTPLTVVLGFLEHLVHDPGMDPATRANFTNMLHDQAQRMNRLVGDLLTLSKLENRQQPLPGEVVDMPALIAALVEDGRALSNGKHVFEVQDEAGNLLGSVNELRSAFGNLVSNAVRYTPAGGIIKLRWHTENGAPVFSVADNGIGIAAEHLPRLTERFYRVDKGRSAQTGGTGLGLAIVKHALLNHQARLEIDSALGAGSTFKAVFPAARLIVSASLAA